MIRNLDIEKMVFWGFFCCFVFWFRRGEKETRNLLPKKESHLKTNTIGGKFPGNHTWWAHCCISRVWKSPGSESCSIAFVE
jgi:hypothetical protein